MRKSIAFGFPEVMMPIVTSSVKNFHNEEQVLLLVPKKYHIIELIYIFYYDKDIIDTGIHK